MKKLVYIILSLWLVCVLAGCKTAKELEKSGFADLEKVIEYRDRYRLDSIFIRDSVIIREKGDTVYKDRWRIEWKERIIRDTVHVGDTVYLEKEVFRERTEPSKNGNYGLIICLTIIIILIYKLK